MDSIDWSEIHHFEMALYRPLFKGIKKKRDTHTLNFDTTLRLSLVSLTYQYRYRIVAAPVGHFSCRFYRSKSDYPDYQIKEAP
jgi:hypothetical protein